MDNVWENKIRADEVKLGCSWDSADNLVWSGNCAK